MKMLMGGLAGLVLALGLAGAASAKMSYLECTKFSGASGWVPSQFVVVREGAARQAIVSDTVGVSRRLPPTQGKVLRDTKSKLRISWKRKRLSDAKGNSATMLFTAVLNKSTGVATITANPQGFNEVFSGKARCAPMSPTKVAQLSRLLKRPEAQRQMKKTNIQSKTYTCALTRKPRDLRFLPTEYKFNVPDAGGTGWVENALSARLSGKRTSAKIESRASDWAVLTWSHGNIRDLKTDASLGALPPKLSVRARVMPGRGSFALWVTTRPLAKPKSYTGTCRETA